MVKHTIFEGRKKPKTTVFDRGKTDDEVEATNKMKPFFKKKKKTVHVHVLYA